MLRCSSTLVPVRINPTNQREPDCPDQAYILRHSIRNTVKSWCDEMKPPCAVVALHVLPAARVIVARKLMEVHELKPAQVASRMGLTPAAVTQYASGVRGGRLVDVLQGSERVRQVLDGLVSEFLKAQSDKSAMLEMVCELCRIVREERMICRFCDLSQEGKECNICLQTRACSRGVSVPQSEH